MTVLVGFIVVEAVIAPLCDPQEPLYSELSNVDGEDEMQLRKVFRNYVKPYYDSFDDCSRAIIADSLTYFSRASRLPEDVSLDALPVPFDFPQDIKSVCIILVDELELSSIQLNIADCEYTDNLSLVHRLRRRR